MYKVQLRDEPQRSGLDDDPCHERHVVVSLRQEAALGESEEREEWAAWGKDSVTWRVGGNEGGGEWRTGERWR